MAAKESKHNKTLIVVTGPTASGKTSLAVKLAKALGTDVISADSRQFYREISIGTAMPSEEEMEGVKHHFIGTLNLEDYYSAAKFEEDVLALLPQIWEKSDYAVICGGSMMYIDAVTRGIDSLPDISEAVRQQVMDTYLAEGLDYMLAWLDDLDPIYAAEVDRSNYKRVVHAIEICLEADIPYSTLRTGKIKERPWRTVTFALNWPREELFERINARVDVMIEAGLVAEAESVYAKRHLNSLNTVGYKELFKHFDGEMPLETAIARIGKNTRVYAKKQLTWMKKRPEINLLDPHGDFLQDALKLINDDES